jgi:hypothetical protein
MPTRREWGTHEDGWFSVLNGEILCRVRGQHRCAARKR